ncbi:MAG: STAS domain-containing protein [Deltaproteobacteria bacterium]|nr:STAS domain-containing protein [Deltaproteobacteria bacterium]
MFEFKNYNDIVVMEVEGELRLGNVRQFDSLLSQAMLQNAGRVVVDLSQLSHIDYKLVPHLVDRVIEIQCQGGEIKLAGGNHYVANILKAMGFDEELYPSVEDAVISFQPHSEEEWQ